jgi:hypothetical protein
MPEINESERTYFTRAITDLQARMTSVETQQNFTVVDSDLNIRAILGLLPGGDYGLAVFDPGGTGAYGEVFPPKRSFYGPVISTTSNVYSIGTGSPSLTFNVGASGDALVIMSANISTTNTNDTGFVGLSGTGPGGLILGAGNLLWAGSTASIIASSASLVISLTELWGSSLPPGEYTLTMEQKGSTNGHTFDFENNGLVVWPV